MNTVANLLTIYDALGGAVERYIVRYRLRNERKTKSSEADYQAALKSTFKQVELQMDTMNKQLRCRLFSPTAATSNKTNLLECLNSSLIQNEDDEEEDDGDEDSESDNDALTLLIQNEDDEEEEDEDEDEDNKSDDDALLALNEVEEKNEFTYNKELYNFFQKIAYH